MEYFQDQQHRGLQVPWCCRTRIDSASLAVFLEGERGGGKFGAHESSISWCPSNPTQHHALVLLLQSWGLLLCLRYWALETPWSTSAWTGKWLHGPSSVRLDMPTPHSQVLHISALSKTLSFSVSKGDLTVKWYKMETYQPENLFHFYSKWLIYTEVKIQGDIVHPEEVVLGHEIFLSHS